MKPKGHRRGCQCVVCAPRKRRTRRKNHGYENQARTLHQKGLSAARKMAKNSTVVIPGTRRARNAVLKRTAAQNPGIQIPEGAIIVLAQTHEPSTSKVRRNTSHYPRTKRGPKGNVRWYILDLFNARGDRIGSRYRKCARAKCATEAAGLVGRKVRNKVVRKVELSGPYSRKPNANTVRK